MLPDKRQRKNVYLLPNILTTLALFTSFYSIIASINMRFEVAAIAIFVAMILDTLDGRVARLIGAQSAFGAQYDSLSDMVSFGVAPAILMYRWSLFSLGELGWISVFIYTAAVALRLARFNVNVQIVDKRYFQGLACPVPAGILASVVWFGSEWQWQAIHYAGIFALSALLLAMLMVSSISYYSFKDIDFKGRIPYMYGLVIVLICAGIAIYPSLVLFLAFTTYALSGPCHTLRRLRRGKRSLKKNEQANKEIKDKY